MPDAQRPTRLLLVADDDSGATRVDSILRDATPTFDITRVHSIAGAVSALERSAPDCLLIDLAAPAAGGRDALEALLAPSTDGAHVAVVALVESDRGVGGVTIHGEVIECQVKATLDGRALAASILRAIERGREGAARDEAERVGHVGSWQVDVGSNVVRSTTELRRMLDLSHDENFRYDELIDRIHPDDRDATLLEIRAALEASASSAVEHRIVGRDGTSRWVRTRVRIETGPDGRAERLFGTVQDIDELRGAAADLRHQELHDRLTGLPNRRLLLDRLGRALARLARVPSHVGVIHLDVDRFRLINDSLGRVAGDQLILATAVRLKNLIRPEDTLARLEGDEFVVLCEGLADEAEAVGIADRICAAMSEPVAWDGGDLVISVSAGIAMAASPSVDPDALLGDADSAVGRAKREGRARSAVFAKTMCGGRAGQLAIETTLRHSIDNGDLLVHYQPIVGLLDGQVLGHEALARWAHPTRGLLGPDEFIAIAEESRLIVPLGAMVLREACMQAKRFQTRDPRWPRLMMSVNLSGVQLGEPDLCEMISAALADADLAAEDLQLEMTESVLMDDAATTIAVLRGLRDIGTRLSIDDFGTGYSSLAYLRRFPVDVLKIDRTFVGGLGKDLEDSAIVAAVVNLADTLGFSTIAEGVETELQRECLIGLGCARAQGYLFARPAAAADAETALDLAGRVTLHS